MLYRESSAVTVIASSSRPTSKPSTSNSVTRVAGAAPPGENAAGFPSTDLVRPTVASPTHPSRRVRVIVTVARASRAAASTETTRTRCSTAAACSSAVADAPAAGATKAGVSAYVARECDTSPIPMPWPTTALETLATCKSLNSTSTPGYARVISTRYSSFVDASCAVTSTATTFLPTRSGTSREYGALLSLETPLPASPPTSTP